jgi:hypothetical protein
MTVTDKVYFKKSYVNPFGAIFWGGFIIGFGAGGILTTLVWWLK